MLETEQDKTEPGSQGEPEHETAIKLDEVRRTISELEAMYRRKQDAAEAYTDSIKAIAKQAGISPQVRPA